MAWKWLVGLGALLIGLAAAGAFLLLPEFGQAEFDPGTPRAPKPQLLHPAYWSGADARPPARIAFERTEVAPGAQQAALLGAPVAAQVQALLKQGHDCDTQNLVVYSRSGRPRSLIATDCRLKGQPPGADKDDYPTLLVLEGAALRELHGLEPYGFKYDSGTLAGVTDLDGTGELQLWLTGTTPDEAQGSVIVADTSEGLKKADYTMDASCKDIRAAEEDGAASCVCGPGLAAYRETFLSPYAGMTLAAVCAYGEAEGGDGEPVPTGIAYFSGGAQLGGVLVNQVRGGGGSALGFAQAPQDPWESRLLFADNTAAAAAAKAPPAVGDNPCWSAKAGISLRVLKTVVANGVAPVSSVQKFVLGKVGKFKECPGG